MSNRRAHFVSAFGFLASILFPGSVTLAQFTYGPNPASGYLFYGELNGQVNAVSGYEPLNLPPGQLMIGSTLVQGQGTGGATANSALAALGVSGSITTTTNGSISQTWLGATGTMSYGLTTPPTNGDFYYYLDQSTITVSGTLASNTSLHFEMGILVNGEPGGTPPNYVFLFNDSSPGSFSKTFLIDQYYLGDWYEAHEGLVLLGGLHFDYQADLSTLTSGVYGSSTVNVDPTFGVAGTNTLVPEPSSLIMGFVGSALLGGVALTRRRAAKTRA